MLNYALMGGCVYLVFKFILCRPEVYRKPEHRLQLDGLPARQGDAFHYISFIPINDRVYELDGLKPYPIDHGCTEICFYIFLSCLV